MLAETLSLIFMIIGIFLIIGLPDCEHNYFGSIGFCCVILSIVVFSYGLHGFYCALIAMGVFILFLCFMWSISWIVNCVSIRLTGEKFLYSGYELEELRRNKVKNEHEK